MTERKNTAGKSQVSGGPNRENCLHVSLTVSESKRLIARALAGSALIRRVVAEGTLAVGSGTTNGYLVEEITGEKLDKRAFVTGRTVPAGFSGAPFSYTRPDLVIRRNERLSVRAVEALENMGPGDVYVKGVNAINYERGQAAVLIGHPTGGGVGAALGRIVARRICYLHPAGLEKNTAGDLDEAAARLNRATAGGGPTLWVVPGPVYTEIEALRDAAGVEAVPTASGGVAGAEGAVWLALFGDDASLEKAAGLIASVRGEPPF